MEDFWSKFIENVMLAFMPVIASLVVGLLYAWVRKVWAQFKETKPDLAWALESAASMAVSAAEQAGAAGLIADKKAYALQIAEDYLLSKGLTVDLHLIDAAIEAAVYDTINKDKLPEKQPAGFASANGPR